MQGLQQSHNISIMETRRRKTHEKRHKRLQQSHNISIMETSKASSTADNYVVLQQSHNISIMETFVIGLWLVVSGLSFNRAIIFLLWKQIENGHLRSLIERLQQSHNISIMETHILTHFDGNDRNELQQSHNISIMETRRHSLHSDQVGGASIEP